jgi:hypothetical protein
VKGFERIASTYPDASPGMDVPEIYPDIRISEDFWDVLRILLNVSRVLIPGREASTNTRSYVSLRINLNPSIAFWAVATEYLTSPALLRALAIELRIISCSSMASIFTTVVMSGGK